MRIYSLFLVLLLLVGCQKEFDTPVTADQQGKEVSVSVQKAGALASFIKSSSIDFYSVDRVVFTGTLNGKDVLEAVRLSSVKGNVKELDFSQTHLLEGAFPKAAFAAANLNKLVFPKNLKHTGERLFYSASKVNEIILPDALEYIDRAAFANANKIPVINIPPTVRFLGEGALGLYENIETFPLPKELEAMGAGVFSYSSITHQEIPHKIKILPKATFSSCKKLQKVALPKDMVRIDTLAFEYCISLKKMDFLPDNVREIGPAVFDWCKFESMKLPSQLERLEAAALRNIAGLKELVIPDKVTYIGEFCFSGRRPYGKDGNYNYIEEYGGGTGGGKTPIQRIYLPKSVTHIGQLTFTNLPDLEELHVKWETPIPHNGCFETLILPSDTFIGIDRSKVTLYVPKGTSQAYRSAEGWKEFTHIVEE